MLGSTGLGIVVPATWLFAVAFFHAFFGRVGGEDAHLVLGSFTAALVYWPLGRALNGPTPEHAFLAIPVQYWSSVAGIVGAFYLFA